MRLFNAFLYREKSSAHMEIRLTREDNEMDSARANNPSEFEETIRTYLNQAREKLLSELVGTREAIRLIASEKTREFIKTMDKGLDKEEREFLSELIVCSMYQSFCYGYGIGKMEGVTKSKVYL